MSKIFLIGIPKSGTTTIQSFLKIDKRIALTRFTFFTTSKWWLKQEEKFIADKNVTNSTFKLRWKSIENVRIHENYIIVSTTDGYGTFFYLINIEQE